MYANLETNTFIWATKKPILWKNGAKCASRTQTGTHAHHASTHTGNAHTPMRVRGFAISIDYRLNLKSDFPCNESRYFTSYSYFGRVYSVGLLIKEHEQLRCLLYLAALKSKRCLRRHRVLVSEYDLTFAFNRYGYHMDLQRGQRL